MNPLLVGAAVFAVLYLGSVLGFALRDRLPSHHHDADSRELRKVGTGLIGTMAALVLGLLVASAKSAYDEQKADLTHLSADIGLLDRTLAHYGAGTEEARGHLRQTAENSLAGLFVRSPTTPTGASEALYDSVGRLVPASEQQQALKEAASHLAMEIARTRWLMHEQAGNNVSMPLLIILVFWLAIIFVNFGLQSKANASVQVALVMSALSVAAAIFLILEMDHPFQGIIRITDAPLRHVINQLGR